MDILPEPSGQGEVLWLEPYPDVLLDQLPADAPDPHVRYESRESVSLAFVRAVQLLPARQRAVLILRDVLGFHAAEVASMLDSSEESVTSALKRARATLDRRLDGDADRDPPPPPDSAAERELVEAFTSAFIAGDVDGLVALLSDDVRIAMPPLPLEYDGRDLAARLPGERIRRPSRPALPDGADEGERPARPRRLRDRSRRQRLPLDGRPRPRPQRRPDQRSHPLRKHPAAVTSACHGRSATSRTLFAFAVPDYRESIQRSSRRASRVMRLGSRKVLVRRETPW